MPYAVTTPEGNVVRLDDVPLEDLGRIADDADIPTWTKLLTEPLRNHRALLAIVAYCCELHGETLPDKPSAKLIVKMFDFLPDDLPDSFEGGVPKAEDDQTTSGSPGAHPDSDGPPPSPEA